jgi:transcription termination factor Rho
MKEHEKNTAQADAEKKETQNQAQDEQPMHTYESDEVVPKNNEVHSEESAELQQQSGNQQISTQHNSSQYARNPAAGRGGYESRDTRPRGRYDTRRTDTRRSQPNRPYGAGADVVEPRTLEEMSVVELNVQARRLGIVGAALMKKDELLAKIKYVEANPDVELSVSGVLERLPDGFGFLRSAHYDYVSGPDDVYVSPSQIRRFGLRTGDMVVGVIRRPKDNEKYFALLKIDLVNSENPAILHDRPHFDRLSPEHPHEKFNLEWKPEAIATRIMDIFTPIGKGQRGLIVAPPKVGKTLLLKEIAQALVDNHKEVFLIVLLVDERPEEVADIKRTLRGTPAEVISSTFDESAERHVQVTDIVLEKAKRLVESGKDVVILLDSITRLARAYNAVAPASGKILTGGIDANALQHPKRFFGAARATEEAGSLTILATAMVDTGSRADEVIYEEFKGTGNMEMHMTRKLSNKRVFPAFDLPLSGTRREELLLSADALNKVWVLQKFLSTMNTSEGIEFLIDKMNKFKTNREFFDSINKRDATAIPTNGKSERNDRN